MSCGDRIHNSLHFSKVAFIYVSIVHGDRKMFPLQLRTGNFIERLP